VAPRVTSSIDSVARQAATDAGQSVDLHGQRCSGLPLGLPGGSPRSALRHSSRDLTADPHRDLTTSACPLKATQDLCCRRDGSALCQLNLVEQCT